MMKSRIIAALVVFLVVSGSKAHAGIRCTSSENTNLGSAITIDIAGNGIVFPQAGVAVVSQVFSRPVEIARFVVDIMVQGAPVLGGPTQVTAQDRETRGGKFFLSFIMPDYQGHVRFLLGGDGVVHENLKCEITPEIERPRR